MPTIDWEICANALNKKLNAVASRLRDNERIDEIIKDFGLDSSEHYPSVDYCDLVKLDAEVGRLIHSLHFASFSSRDAILEKLHKVHSDFSMSLVTYGAFI